MSTAFEAEPPAGSPGRLSTLVRILAQQIIPLLAIVWINGVVLRITVRDSSDLLAPLYYATPWPVLAVLTLVLLKYFWRKPIAVFAIIFVAHLFGGVWIVENWRPPAQSRERADLRVLHWNVARPWASRTEIVTRVKAYDADVIAISEALPLSGRGETTSRARIVADEWRTSFPGFSYEQGEKGLVCLIRGEVLQRRLDTLHPGSVYALYDARVKERPIRILQVDIDARPVHPRRKALASLVELVGTLADQPLILAGDFNIPRDSIHLEPLSEHMQHAWLSAGAGSAETWPSFFPVLSLDQVWSGYGVRAVRCRHGVTFRSDHRPVFAEFKFE